MAALPDLEDPSNEQEPPEAEAVLLEGLAMAGLVAVLRQLGDLAELAAEVLDGLQDQVMAVSARGRRLAMRAKHLQDAHLTPSSIVVHSKTNSHPRLDKVKERLMSQHEDGVVVEAPPRSVVVDDHIKRCRGPPCLSALDRFDAHGEGACLKRYTDPSFFRTAHSAKLQTHTDGGCRSQTDASGKENQQSLGFLSMLRQLTHPGSVSPSPNQTHQISRIPCKHYESSPEPHMEMDKAKENHRGSVGQSKDELERSSSLEAWLSPGAFEYETTDEESSQRAFSRLLVNHDATSNGPLATDDNAKQDYSEAAETSCNKILIAASSGVNNSCSQDTKVDAPALVPIPPMQWLSVKVHTGPITCRKSFGGKILKATELSEPAIHSYEAWPSEPEGTDQQSGAEARWQQVFHDKGPEISSCRGNTVSDSEANRHGNPSQASGVGVGGEDTLHHENAFVSAVEQLARMSSPPWVPRRVASCDRITLRNGPSPIHRSRSILDSQVYNHILQSADDMRH